MPNNLMATRMDTAQSIANEYGWGEVIGIEQNYGPQKVELVFQDGIRFLNELLSYEILRHPVILKHPANKGCF